MSVEVEVHKDGSVTGRTVGVAESTDGVQTTSAQRPLTPALIAALREADDLIAFFLRTYPAVGPLTEFNSARKAHDTRMAVRGMGGGA